MYNVEAFVGNREVMEAGSVFGAWLNNYRKRRSVEHGGSIYCDYHPWLVQLKKTLIVVLDRINSC